MASAPQRWAVRARPELFDTIDYLLAGEQRSDFLVNHLFAIVDQFAARFDRLATVRGRDPARWRFLVGATESLGYVVAGRLAPDGVIELYDIEFDLNPPWADRG